MRTFNDLTEALREQAQAKALEDLLSAILDGSIRFNDKLNEDNLQGRIDAAIQKADAMQTPWFAAEYILDTCREDLEGMARCDAEDALYPEPGERVIRLDA